MNLSDMRFQNLQKQIRDLAEGLSSVAGEEGTLERLQKLSADLGSDSRWYVTDRWRVFNPELVAENVERDYLARYNSRLVAFVLLRNLLLLAMLLCAAGIFIFPWFQITGFVLLAVSGLGTVFLTFLVTKKVNELQTLARQVGRRWAVRLENFLLELDVVSYENRQIYNADAEGRSLMLLESIHNFVEVFNQHSVELEKMIGLEQQRLSLLAETQSRELEEIQAIRNGLAEFSQVLVTSGTQFSQALQQFQSAASTVFSSAGHLAQIQGSALEISQRIETHLSSFEKVMTQLGQIEKKMSNDLLKATTQNLNKSTELTVLVDGLSKVVRQIGESQVNLQNLLDDQMRATDSWVKSMQKSMGVISRPAE